MYACVVCVHARVWRHYVHACTCCGLLVDANLAVMPPPPPPPPPTHTHTHTHTLYLHAAVVNDHGVELNVGIEL